MIHRNISVKMSYLLAPTKEEVIAAADVDISIFPLAASFLEVMVQCK